MLLVPFFCLITALAFAAFGIAVAGTVNKIDQFSYVTTLFVTPLFLVAGTFFPIDGLPEGFQIAAQLNPLHHLVELVRHACFGFEATDPIRLVVLIGLAVGLWRLAVRQMTARLIDRRPPKRDQRAASGSRSRPAVRRPVGREAVDLVRLDAWSF
jgi:lipooligosaccharide transport system permease protein